MNSVNSKTSDPHRLVLKIDLKRRDKCIALLNLSIYYLWRNIRDSYKNTMFNISALTWSESFF